MKILIDSNNESTSCSADDSQRSNEYIHKCKVCEAPATYSNFGIICCPPCKMFFKRNAEKERLLCTVDNHCEVNSNNRRICSACRLAKCFAKGMKIELLRSSRPNKNRKRKMKKMATTSDTNQSQQLSTFNLLQCNQSILNLEQWNILTYLFSSFNQETCLLSVKQFICEQNNLPFKLRFKYGPIRELASVLINDSQLSFEKNRDYLSLCSHDRSFLLHRLMKYVAIISISFIAQQTHLIDEPSCYAILRILIEKTGILTNKHGFTLLENFDVRVSKLILAIICFSTIDYIVYEKISANNLMNIKRITEIQDLYIELTWRYLIHQYNEQQAIIYFSNLIKYIFNVHELVILMQDEKCFTDIINSTIEQTEVALTDCN